MTIEKERNAFLISYRVLWIFGAFFVGVEGIVFAVAAFIYFKALRKSIENLRAQRSSSPASIRQLSAMIQSYRSLTLTAIASLALTLSYFIANVFLAVNIKMATSGGEPGLIITLAAIYPQAVFGPICSAFILVRSFSAKSSNATGDSIPTTNIALPRQTSNKLPLAGETTYAANELPFKIESETAKTYYRSESDYDGIPLAQMMRKEDAPFGSQVH